MGRHLRDVPIGTLVNVVEGKDATPLDRYINLLGFTHVVTVVGMPGVWCLVKSEAKALLVAEQLAYLSPSTMKRKSSHVS